MDLDRQRRGIHPQPPEPLVKPYQLLIKGSSQRVALVYRSARKKLRTWQLCLTGSEVGKPLRIALAATLAIVGTNAIAGLAPIPASGFSPFQMIPRVNAQSFSPVSESEVRQYAQAVLAMEPLRQNAFTNIQQLLGNAEMPSLTCHHQNVIPGDLPNAAIVRQIVRDYCDRSMTIVGATGLSIARFNEITMQLRNNPVLQQRVQAELIKLQQFPTMP